MALSTSVRVTSAGLTSLSHIDGASVRLSMATPCNAVDSAAAILVIYS